MTISPVEPFPHNFGNVICVGKNVTEKPESYGQIAANGLSLT